MGVAELELGLKLGNTDTENNMLGKFGELAYPVQDLGKSVLFWEGLGFEQTHTSQTPYPFAILTDSKVTIGLHQNEGDFDQPALTYFSKNTKEKVETLKTLGYKIEKDFEDDQGEYEGSLLRSPDGHIILLFQGEI